MSLPAAVLWDLDGTLIDSEKLWDIPLYELAERLGGRLSQPTRAAMVGTNVPTTLDLLFADVGIIPDADQRAEAARWLDKRMAELYAADVPWQPGAREALATIRATGLPTALVTSTERPLTELALDTIGRDHFDVTVCGDEVDGRNKPLPDPYLKAARLLDVAPTHCLAIEDSPSGTTSAVAAGCTVLVIPSEVEVPPGPRRIFRDSLVGLTPTDLEAAFNELSQPPP
ncbi:MAG TPA: HAD family phosphatase [Actinophytocola sp.]|uniref:HAD family hydrolase n=1 Tax=Actinophytocola sp. TaxID=1872138 RepID=UPI002DDD0F4D|nr:HAD family phosphatase [Actinophytocola sp.]HEV2783377.1 HAD family phosphatase [Actinophytocola sp.]